MKRRAESETSFRSAAVPVFASIDSLRIERGAFPFLQLRLDAGCILYNVRTLISMISFISLESNYPVPF
jgi:hypothetical protein